MNQIYNNKKMLNIKKIKHKKEFYQKLRQYRTKI